MVDTLTVQSDELTLTVEEPTLRVELAGDTLVLLNGSDSISVVESEHGQITISDETLSITTQVVVEELLISGIGQDINLSTGTDSINITGDGLQGPPGPTGPQGPPGAAEGFVFEQETPSDTWIVPHMFGRLPAGSSVYIDGVEVGAAIEVIDANTIRVCLNSEEVGFVSLI